MKRQRGTILLVPVIIIAIIAVAGAYLLGKQGITIFPQPSPTSLPAEVPTKEGDVTADWKTYTNTKYQYSIKYPLTFSVTEQSSEYVRLSLGQNQPNQPSSETYLSIEVKNNPQKLSLQKWEKANVNVADHAPFPKGVTYLEHDGTIFQITPVIIDRKDTDGSIGKTFDQILSTFKFLK